MKYYSPRGRFIPLIIIMTAVLTFSIGHPPVAAGATGGPAPQTHEGAIEPSETVGAVTVTIRAGSCKIRETAGGHEIRIEDFGRLPVPGKPALPARIFSIGIPPGATPTGVTFDGGERIVLPGTYRIAPVEPPDVIGNGMDGEVLDRMRQDYDATYNAVYGSDDPCPGTVGEFVRRAGYRKYNLVDIRISPFDYRPVSGRLIYCPEVTVTVDYKISSPVPPGKIIADDQARTERIARSIIVNYDQAGTFYPSAGVPPRKGTHDYVVITTEALAPAVQELVDWETAKGRTVTIVTTQWIDANCDGVDLQQKMRHFLVRKYPTGEWGIEDVLFVGHYDDVPLRRTAPNAGFGSPETDFYYAELSTTDDQSWDKDGDGRYGEWGGDSVDFYNEVNVGRIPWSEYDTVAHICAKSIAYEQNNDLSFKQNILLLGAYFWADTDNAVLMEAKVDQAWMTDWTMTRMYEQNWEYWSDYPCDYPLNHNNVTDVWPAGTYSFVNWAGHGSPTSCHILGQGAPHFINSNDCPLLNDDYPAVIFADACSNSDTDALNIGQAMMKQGAVGFLGATKVAMGCAGWDHPLDGSSQSLDYFFTTTFTSNSYSMGEAHQWALREMYLKGLWMFLRYETYEWGALWGNPNLRLMGISEVVVDNTRPEFDVLAGSWKTNYHFRAYFDDVRYSPAGAGENRAGWRVDTRVTPGSYDVYAWKFEHPVMDLMATNAPYRIYHAGGKSDWIRIDQSAPGTEWIYIGTFDFDDSSMQGVVVGNDADGFVLADAIKLVRN